MIGKDIPDKDIPDKDIPDKDIPDKDNVARYCSPGTINEYNMPTITAFRFRKGEEFLSVNWLEFLVQSNVSEAVDQLRELFPGTGYEIRKRGMFAVLGVGDIKTAVSEVTHMPQIKHRPKPKNHSHAGIYIDTNKYAASQALERLIRHNPKNVHPAIVYSSWDCTFWI